MSKPKGKLILGLSLLMCGVVFPANVSLQAYKKDGAMSTMLNQTIKKIFIKDYPEIGSNEHMIHVNGPGPIVSNQWRYYYSITSIVETRNIQHTLIENYNNETSNNWIGKGKTSYSLRAPTSEYPISKINGTDIETCSDYIKSVTPYIDVGKYPSNQATPKVNVGAHSHYAFWIYEQDVQYTIKVRKESRYWSWGSWKPWVKDGADQTLKNTFTVYYGRGSTI